MDAIFASNLNDEHKRIVNLIRTKLNILTASDLVLAGSGTIVCPNISNGKKPTNKYLQMATSRKNTKEMDPNMENCTV